MQDHLLKFDDESTAIAALPSYYEDGWRGDVLAVALVTAEAVHGERDDIGNAPVLSPRQQLPGFFLLVPDAALPGELAAIERATGRVVSGSQDLAGARLDPAWAGSEPLLSAGGSEPETEPVPAAISDRQFAQQLAVLGTISEAEALAWAARGELPEPMETAIAALPEQQRFSARMLLASATTYERSHPLVPLLADLLGYDEAELDDLWRAAAAL